MVVLGMLVMLCVPAYASNQARISEIQGIIIQSHQNIEKFEKAISNAEDYIMKAQAVMDELVVQDTKAAEVKKQEEKKAAELREKRKEAIKLAVEETNKELEKEIKELIEPVEALKEAHWRAKEALK